MKLFHYHYWTDRVEETENFYKGIGFEVIYRFSKDRTYHPPLTWDDFRSEDPKFRVIEMRKGNVNITFGFGKKPIFDHIGYLVTEVERDKICERASFHGWKTEINDRRSFIGTPFGLRIELQCRNEVVEETSSFSFRKMNISFKRDFDFDVLRTIFNHDMKEIHFTKGESLHLQNVSFTNSSFSTYDPNGVEIVGEK